MITHFHGITGKAYANLMAGNTDKSLVVSPWICSDNDSKTYLWPIEHFIEEYDCTATEAVDYAVNEAFSSAVIQAAMNTDSDMYVLGLDLSGLAAEIETDYSCENMQHAQCIDSELITTEVIAKTWHCKSDPYMHPVVLAGLLSNYQFNKTAVSPALLAMSEVLTKTSYCELYDMAFQFDYSEV